MVCGFLPRISFFSLAVSVKENKNVKTKIRSLLANWTIFQKSENHLIRSNYVELWVARTSTDRLPRLRRGSKLWCHTTADQWLIVFFIIAIAILAKQNRYSPSDWLSLYPVSMHHGHYVLPIHAYKNHVHFPGPHSTSTMEYCLSVSSLKFKRYNDPRQLIPHRVLTLGLFLVFTAQYNAMMFTKMI